MKIRKLVISAFLLLFFLSLHAAGDGEPKYEYRAVWLTTVECLDWPATQVKSPADTLVQQRELTALLDSLQTLGVNTVLFQTRLRGDVIYPSSLEPFSHVLTGSEGKSPGYDPLAFAITECHKRGMHLHAWLVTFPLGKDAHVKRLGARALSRTRPALCTRYKGECFMEPGNPDTADYLCAIVAEITENYDVDGIHLDYVRYPDRTNGYPDGALFRRYGKGRTLADWRRANVTAVVEKIHATVKNIKPWVRLSCAPLGKYTDLTRYSSLGWNAREAVYQEAQEWLQRGIMDILFPMLYYNGNNFYPFVLDWQENAGGGHIVPGVGIYRLLPEYGGWQPLEIERQLRTARSAGTAGSAMFRARHILENAAGATDVYSAVYRKKALVPPLDRVETPAPLPPSSIAVEQSGDTFKISWGGVHSLDNHPAATYNVYAALGDTVDVGNIDNLQCAALGDTAFVWVCRTLKPVSLAVTAVDAYGRESLAARACMPGREPLCEITLPAPYTWGLRIEICDIYGRVVYGGRYATRVIVGGLPQGDYLLKILDRDGKFLSSRYFKR